MESGKRPTILLVDDNRHLVVTLSDFLTYEGYDIVAARSGEEALKKLEGLHPDLIILDVSMPGMGGIGFLKRITGPDDEPRYPVLVFTARSAMEEFFGTIKVAGFVAKPCSEVELLREIRAVIASRSADEEETETAVRCILIGEDDEEVMWGLRRRFANAGYQVEEATSGASVLEQAAVCRPAAILVKEILPGMNGRVVAPLIRAMPSTRHVPIVLYDDTRFASDDSKFGRRGRPEGVTEYLTTSNPTDLVAVVNRLVL